MGSWSEDNFGNDSALDWLSKFLNNPELSRVEQTLKRAKQELHSADSCELGLVAAEVIAALNGNPATTLPEQLGEYVGSYPGPVGKSLSTAAQAVVSSVLKSSELKALWQESADFKIWQQIQQDLLARLKTPPARKVKTTATKKSAAKGKPPLIWIYSGEEWCPSGRPFYFGSAPLPDLAQDTITVTIDLAESYSDTDLVQLARWVERYPKVKLHLVSIGKRKNTAFDPQRISAFCHAEKLWLNLNTLKTLDLLSSFKNLALLIVSDCSGVRDWSVVSQLKTLRSVVLRNTSTIDSLSFLAALPKLQSLSLSSLTNLANLNSVTELSELMYLDISEMPLGTELPNLSTLKKLRYLCLRLCSKQLLKAAATAPALVGISVFRDENTKISMFEPLKRHPTLSKHCVSGWNWEELSQEVSKLLGTKPSDPKQWRSGI